jgi:hypothetical protein
VERDLRARWGGARVGYLARRERARRARATDGSGLENLRAAARLRATVVQRRLPPATQFVLVVVTVIGVGVGIEVNVGTSFNHIDTDTDPVGKGALSGHRICCQFQCFSSLLFHPWNPCDPWPLIIRSPNLRVTRASTTFVEQGSAPGAGGNNRPHQQPAAQAQRPWKAKQLPKRTDPSLQRTLQLPEQEPGHPMTGMVAVGLPATGVGVEDGLALGVAVAAGGTVAVGVAVGVAVVLAGMGVGVGVGGALGVWVALAVGDGVTVAEKLAVRVGVKLAVGVCVDVAVALGGIGVAEEVGETLALWVAVGDAVAVTEKLAVGDGIAVGESLAVALAVTLAVGV